MKKYLVMLAAILLCLFIGGAPFAVAQDEEAEDEFTLEEITVTAQKREENQQKVAIAMEVITGEDLTAMGKNDIDEILKDIANVEIASASTGTRINIRGLVDDNGTFGGDYLEIQSPMVSMNIDGAYSSMHSAGNNLFDIERVEVLMGPQSTMYGANSPAGIINIVTAAPKTDKYSGNVSVEYGSYDLLNVQGALNVPVIQDTLALRVSANNSTQGTWVEGDPDSESTSVRLKALWDVYENLDFTVTGNWSKKSSGGMMGGTVKPFLNQDDDTYPDGTPLTDPWTLDPDARNSVGSLFDDTSQGLSADINWSLPFGDLALVPSYSESEANGWRTNNSGTAYYQIRESEQTGYEARMTNPESFELFEWIAGGTYSKFEQYSLADYASDASDSGRTVFQEKTAVYANITYPTWFSDRLRLTLGFRQSWDESNGTEVHGTNVSYQGNQDRISKPNWKYGFEYDLADNMMLYGNYSSSYRSTAALGMETNPPEILKSYTAGIKSRWLDNRLQANLNVYYYDYSNKHATGMKHKLITEADYYPEGYDGITPVEPYESSGGGAPPPPPGQGPPPPGGPGGGGTVYYQENDTADPTDEHYVEPDGINPSQDDYDWDEDGIYDEDFEYDLADPWSSGTGTFHSLGVDLQTTFIITSKDRLNLSIAYLDAEWEDLTFLFKYGPQNADTDFADDYPDFRWNIFPPESYAGVAPPNSPKWGVTANYQHNFLLGALGTLTPRIDMKYKSEYRTRGGWDEYMDGYIYTWQEAYTMWDASAAFQHSSGKWSLNVYAKNLTNYAVKTQVYIMGDGSTEMRLGDPRTYGVTFSYKFF